MKLIDGQNHTHFVHFSKVGIVKYTTKLTNLLDYTETYKQDIKFSDMSLYRSCEQENGTVRHLPCDYPAFSAIKNPSGILKSKSSGNIVTSPELADRLIDEVTSG